MKQPSEGNKQAHDLRESGLTFKQIGDRFGISASAARFRVKDYQRWLENNKNTPSDSVESLDIPQLVVHALNCGGVESIRDLYSYSFDEVLEFPYMGLESIAKLRSAIRGCGMDDAPLLSRDMVTEPEKVSDDVMPECWVCCFPGHKHKSFNAAMKCITLNRKY